jgi:methyltransferase (TIGR00027 family)
LPGRFSLAFFNCGRKNRCAAEKLAMKDHNPSRTALRVALRRAAHQFMDDPRVLDDPLAVPIVGKAIEEIQTDPRKFQSKIAKYFRAFMVARSRYAEDQLARALTRGTEQYLILGAGLDTSAYRGLGATSGIAVYEVDHPDTQAWKRARLAAAGIAIPEAVTYVAVDFERHTLPEQLAAAGFHGELPTFVSWLGVVPYLTRKTAEETFGYLGKLSEGSGVVFDYAVAPASLGLMERVAMKTLTQLVARAGEPFKLFFEPVELDEFLSPLGFRRIEQLGSQEINARYFQGRTDGLRVAGGLGRIVAAWI